MELSLLITLLHLIPNKKIKIINIYIREIETALKSFTKVTVIFVKSNIQTSCGCKVKQGLR